MKSMSMIRHTLVGVVAVVAMSACALEPETPGSPGSEDTQPGIDTQEAQHDEHASEDQDPEAKAATPGDAALITIDATPTCNSVRDWFNAAVPDWSGNGTVDCNMVRGDNSGAVSQLQRSMNVCYGEHLALDGDFGGLTQAALIRTQQKAGTPADGQYGPNTRKAMRHESNQVPGTCIRVP